jgi:hypothetical protein
MHISERTRIPEFRLLALLEDLKNLYGQVGSKEVGHGVAAQTWKHASPKSGAFKSKLGSMRVYGLIEGKVNFRVTALGGIIARSQNEEEYNQAIVRAIRNVPLWNILYEKYTNQNRNLTTNELKYDLESEYDLPPNDAEQKAQAVLKEYNEDLKAIRRFQYTKESMMIDSTRQEPSSTVLQPNINDKTTPPPPPDNQKKEDLERITFENMTLFIPRQNLEEAWDLFKDYMQVYLKRHFPKQ